MKKDTHLPMGDFAPAKDSAIKMIELKWEPRDLWIGVFVGVDAVYICLLPTIVIKLTRRPA